MKRKLATATVILTEATTAKRAKVTLPETFLDAHPSAFNDGLQHILKLDPSLQNIISEKPFHQFSTADKQSQPHYEQLFKSIISQQIHPKAALKIEGNFVNKYGHSPSPEEVFNTPDEELRAVGLGKMKASYLKSVADHFLNKGLGEFLEEEKMKEDEEIVQRLVEIKGIGEWSAKMFLIFGLQRLDIFAEGDLGIRRGFSYYVQNRKHLLEQFEASRLYAKTNAKRNWKTYKDDVMLNVMEEFKPYRTVMMLIFWRLAALDTSSLS